jgi:hypothetical protein
MKKYLLLFLLMGTVVMMVVMAKTGASLATKDTPIGILNLELPFNKLKADSVVTAWKTSFDKNGTVNIQVAKTNTWWDFLFMIFYSSFLFVAVTKLADNFNGGFGRAGKNLAKAAFIVAALDIAENIGLFQMLNGNITHGIALFTSICSTIKWLLAIVIVLYMLLTAPIALYYNKLRN